MQCAHPASERYVCCFVLNSLLLCRFAFGSLPSFASLALPILLHRRFCLLLHLTFHLVLLQLHSIMFFHVLQFSVFCCFTSAQCCQLRRLVEGGLTTHCPCQLKTGPVSSRQIHMSIVYTPLFTSSLITVPSRMFRKSGVFILFFKGSRRRRRGSVLNNDTSHVLERLSLKRKEK